MILRVLALCALVAFLCHGKAKAQEVLTNSSIIELVDAGFDEGVIISSIKAKKNAFDVGTTEKMIALRKANVSQNVIAAMVEASSDPLRRSVDLNDYKTPHRPGVYYYEGNRLVEFLPTNLPENKTRGGVGNVLSGGWAKMKIKAQVSGTRSSNVFDPIPKFYFYFNQQATGFDQTTFSYYGFTSASSPREFSLAEMQVRDGGRELEIGSMNKMTVESGLDGKQIRQFESVTQLAPGIFEVVLPSLPAGEYCMLHSTMGSWQSTQQKIYDFHTNGFRATGHLNGVPPPPTMPQEPVQEQRTNQPPATPQKSAPVQEVVKPAPVPATPVEPEVQVPPTQPVRQEPPPTLKTQEAIVVDEPPKPIKSEAPPSGSENVKTTTMPLVEKKEEPSRESSAEQGASTKKASNGSQQLRVEEKVTVPVPYPLNVPSAKSDAKEPLVSVPVRPDPLPDNSQAPAQTARRTRVHFGLDWGLPTDLLPKIMSSALGGAVSLEFGSFSKIRPLLDFSYMHAGGKVSERLSYRLVPTRDFISGSFGLRGFTGKEQTGFHLDMLFGVNLMRTSSLADQVSFSPAAGFGALLFNRLDISCRYQLLLDGQYFAVDRSGEVVNLLESKNSLQGLVVLRTALVVGGGFRPQHAGVPKSTRTARSRAGQAQASNTVRGANAGTCRQKLGFLQLQVDSLSGQLNERKEHIALVEQKTQELNEQLANARTALALAQKEVEAASQSARTPNRPDEGLATDGSFDRCVAVNEQFARFGANAEQVYTLLHTFSDPLSLDTFRVITILQGKAYKHELHIACVNGYKYTEQLFALPLESADAPSRCTDQEVEFLRVRQALSPGNFRMRPMSVSEWQRSNKRANNDLAYDVSVEEYQKAFEDKPLVGFTFQSDEVRRKTLVWSPSLGRIVNVEPEMP